MRRESDVGLRRHKNHLYVALTGDFDAICACRLFRVLDENQRGADVAFIDTEHLESIRHEGRDSLAQDILSAKSWRLHLVFLGRNSKEMALGWHD